MNKGESNNVGRLGSKSYSEPWDERVRSMPKASGEVEQPAHDSGAEGEEFSVRYTAAITTFASLILGCFIVGILIARMYDEDQVKLHILDALMKIFQTIARITGGWALQCENAYNEYVHVLH